MKQKLLSLILMTALACSLLPQNAHAENTEHTHKICGSDSHDHNKDGTDDSCAAADVTYTPLSTILKENNGAYYGVLMNLRLPFQKIQKQERNSRLSPLQMRPIFMRLVMQKSSLLL